MIDEILQTRHKKHIKDLNIVPILDMLVTVIFFLLMSTTFIEYTKLTLPPSSTVTTTSTSDIPPLAPKIRVSQSSNDYLIQLTWGGTSPGQQSATANSESLLKKVHQLVQDFSQKHPQEKTLQVSMERSIKYQILISLMDGARDFLPDIILASYEGGRTP